MKSSIKRPLFFSMNKNYLTSPETKKLTIKQYNTIGIGINLGNKKPSAQGSIEHFLSQRDFNDSNSTSNHYIKIIKQKDNEIEKLKEEIAKIKLSNNSFSREGNRLSLRVSNLKQKNPSYFIKKNSNVDDILRHCEKLIIASDTPNESDSFATKLNKIKQKSQKILNKLSN